MVRCTETLLMRLFRVFIRAQSEFLFRCYSDPLYWGLTAKNVANHPLHFVEGGNPAVKIAVARPSVTSFLKRAAVDQFAGLRIAALGTLAGFRIFEGIKSRLLAAIVAMV